MSVNDQWDQDPWDPRLTPEAPINPTEVFSQTLRTLATVRKIQKTIKKLSEELIFIANDLEQERANECTHAWYRVTCDQEYLKCRHCCVERRAPYATTDLNHLLPRNHPSRYPRDPRLTERLINARRNGEEEDVVSTSGSD